MGTHQFDKQVKDKLQFHEMELPGGMWEKIEEHLPKEQKNRPIPFHWIISIASIFFLGMTLFIVNQNYENVVRTKVADQPLVNQISDKYSTKANPEIKNYEASVTSEDPGSSLAHVNKEGLGLDGLASAAIKKPNLARNFNPTSPVSMYSTKAQNHTENAVFEEMATIVSSQQGHRDRLAVAPHLYSRVAGVNVKHSRQKFQNKDACLKEFNNKGKNVGLEVYYGNDFAIRHMRSRDAQFDKLTNSRKESETPLYAYSLGARLGFNLNEDFKLLTGFHFSQIKEKFEFIDPESSQTKVVKTTLYIKDSQGNIKDSTFTFDTIFIPGTLVYKIRNQYSMMDVPFLVGYQVLQKEKISLTLHAGVLANLVFKKEGMALINDQHSVKSFDNLPDNTFHHSIGLSSYLGAQFSYRLIPSVDFFLEPNIRFMHRGLTTADYPISQSYTTVSFLTGARYNF